MYTLRARYRGERVSEWTVGTKILKKSLDKGQMGPRERFDCTVMTKQEMSFYSEPEAEAWVEAQKAELEGYLSTPAPTPTPPEPEPEPEPEAPKPKRRRRTVKGKGKVKGK